MGPPLYTRSVTDQNVIMQCTVSIIYIHDNGSMFNVSINTLQEVSLPTSLINLITFLQYITIIFTLPISCTKQYAIP